MYQVTKTYGHERGISCAFRQHKATSHCNQIHGYALSFSFVFASKTLNSRNWVIDFGDLKRLENALKDWFDHKLVIANDDPYKSTFIGLRDAGIADLIFLPSVGCEAFARQAYAIAAPLLGIINHENQTEVKLVSVTVAEHGSNSATYIP